MEIFVLMFVVMLISDVAAAGTHNDDIIGMAVAGCVSFIIFSVVITIIVVSLHWKKWFNNWMRVKGKIRMPRAYFRKKAEARKRLVSASGVSLGSQVKGFRPSSSVTQKDTIVEEWRQRARHSPPRRVYEEQLSTMQLGEEIEDDFTIETEVLDDVPIIRHHDEKNRHNDDEVPPFSHTYELLDLKDQPRQNREDNSADVEYSIPKKVASNMVSAYHGHNDQEIQEQPSTTSAPVLLATQPDNDVGIENLVAANAALKSAIEDKDHSDDSSSSSGSQGEKITSF